MFTLAFWLSIFLALNTCFGMYVVGKGQWQGWAIGLASQPVWALFAVITKSYGLLITCVIFGSTYYKNLMKWRREKKAADEWNYNSIAQASLSPNEVRRLDD